MEGPSAVKVTPIDHSQPPDDDPGGSGRWQTVRSALDNWGRTTRLIVILVALALTSTPVIVTVVWWLLRR